MARQSSALNNGKGLMKPSRVKANADPACKLSCMERPFFRGEWPILVGLLTL
jgi:hypothetical protein